MDNMIVDTLTLEETTPTHEELIFLNNVIMPGLALIFSTLLLLGLK
jgi:hypothetical protein